MSNQQIVGQQTDAGQVRATNQDAVASLSFFESVDSKLRKLYLFIVADGMGSDGERAASLVTRIVTCHVYYNVLAHMLRVEAWDAPEGVLREALQKAHEALCTQLKEAQSTATVALVFDDQAYIAHIGENRAYLIHEGAIEQLTQDHVPVPSQPEQISELLIEPVEPTRSFDALGSDEPIDFDAVVRSLPRGSHLLLCSDGLWNVVTDEEILHTVTTRQTPQADCEALIRLANQHGGPDNISAIVFTRP